MRVKKRGFTLLELTIVMAVTAIMAAGIVTFCVTVKNISDNTRNTNNALSDIDNIRQATADWLSYFDTEGFAVGAQGGAEESDTGNMLVATRQTDKQTFTLQIVADEDKNYSLACAYPNADGSTRTVTIPLNGIRMTKFAEITSADGKVTYTPDGGTEQTADMGGKRVFECTVTCFVNNANGGIGTTETRFLLATRRTAV